MTRLLQRVAALRTSSLFERPTSRRLLSVLLLSLGVANLVWLNGQIYPKYRGAASRPDPASVVPDAAITQDGEIRSDWMKSHLARQAALVGLPFEPAGYLPKVYLAQIRNFALELAKRKGNYWVLVSGSTDPSLQADRGLAQSKQRVSFVRDLLVQSGLKDTRVLMDAQRLTAVQGPFKAHLLLEIRVLEVQTQ